jgi:Zn-dependent protease
MVISLMEIVDILAMTIAVGWIFRDIFSQYLPGASRKDLYIVAALATAPGIIVHELGHKFVALAFGYTAVFNAAYPMLVLGIIMKYVFGFVFFVPAYVSIGCVGFCTIPPLSSSLIAFAGPAVNGLMWIGCKIAVDKGNFSKKTMLVLAGSRTINGFLFIFNMLPVPLFDGFKVYQGILSAIFG